MPAGSAGQISDCPLITTTRKTRCARHGIAPRRNVSKSPVTAGRGRTGTALACIAVLDGVAPQQAVAFVREHYDPRAVETPWQRRYVRRFPGP